MNNEEKENIINFSFDINEKLNNCSLEEAKKQSSPPERYTEASLIKKLQADEIGRPSTYATIVETVLSESRGYATKDGKNIVPTEKGIQLASFLDRAFNNIIKLDYTKELEESLDKIADGKIDRIQFLQDFYTTLETTVKSNKEMPMQSEEYICPDCGAKMVIRRNKFGKLFAGCSTYPKCRGIVNIN